MDFDRNINNFNLANLVEEVMYEIVAVSYRSEKWVTNLT